MKDARILDTMTVAETLQFIASPAQKFSLQYWADTFNVALRDFLPGHFFIYSAERSKTAPLHQVFAEMRTLAGLLEEQGVKIDLSSVPLEENLRPTHDELVALPAHIRKYILTLEDKVDSLRLDNRTTSDRLRKANWSRWSR
jgi:hypothetical protein